MLQYWRRDFFTWARVLAWHIERWPSLLVNPCEISVKVASLSGARDCRISSCKAVLGANQDLSDCDGQCVERSLPVSIAVYSTAKLYQSRAYANLLICFEAQTFLVQVASSKEKTLTFQYLSYSKARYLWTHSFLCTSPPLSKAKRYLETQLARVEKSEQ